MYTCAQSPWKGRKLSAEQDTFNYYLSLHRQCVERAFGILVRRWGILWRKLEIQLSKIPILLKCLARLHNVCVNRFGVLQSILRSRLDSSGGEVFKLRYTDQTSAILTQGRRTDLEGSDHRDYLTNFLKVNGSKRPEANWKYSKVDRG